MRELDLAGRRSRLLGVAHTNDTGTQYVHLVAQPWRVTRWRLVPVPNSSVLWSIALVGLMCRRVQAVWTRSGYRTLCR